MLFRPRDSHDQRLISAEIAISPKPSAMRWIHDVFGNCVAIVSFDEKAKELRFEATIVLDHTPRVPAFRDRGPAPRPIRSTMTTKTSPIWSRPSGGSIPDETARSICWARRFVDAHAARPIPGTC